VRFDISTVQYREGTIEDVTSGAWLGPPSPVLSAAHILPESVADGSLDKTRYASDGGPCLVTPPSPPRRVLQLYL
jgi:hypothetical protein